MGNHQIVYQGQVTLSPGGWLVGHVRTSRRVSAVDTQVPVGALLPPDALLQAKLPTTEWNLSLAGPGSLSTLPHQLWRALTPVLALAWLMEDEQGVFLKAACSPLWGLLTAFWREDTAGFLWHSWLLRCLFCHPESQSYS